MDASAMQMPDRALLTEREALNWIAFGDATDADLIGWESVFEKWSLDGPAEIRGMVDALRAAASGRPSSPNGTDDADSAACAYLLLHFEERARMLVEKMGRPAAELANELQGELTALDGRRAALQHAESVLAEAVVEERVSQAEPPGLAAYRRRGSNIVWYRKAQIVCLRPMPAGAPGAARTKPNRNRGGRPPKWNWTAFDAEVVRLANTPDGLPERAILTRQMLDWCDQAWGDTPAESMVRDRISKLYPQ